MGFFDWLNKKSDADQAPADHDPDDGDSAQIESQLPRSEVGERLVDEGQIAKGGMGVIRRVFNRNLLRREAMKILDPGVAADDNELLRFLEEAQITGQLEHPNIPAVHEVGENANGSHFFTMKLVKGKTLEQILCSPKYSVADDEQLFQVLQTFIKICDAIAFAHSRGVIHCDLKPPNIMVGKFGQVYVMDWGIARVKGAKRKRRTETGADVILTVGRNVGSDHGRVMGTLSYMPPEQAHGNVEEIDERTDIFSLGALLYRILTGRAPHVGQSPEETWELAKACEIAEPQALMDFEGKDLHLPPKLCRVAMKALQADKAYRFASVAEMQAEVEEFVRGSGRYPTQSFEAGELVIRQGDAGAEAYVILKGTARVYRTENGTSKTLRQLGPGQVFGETAILTDQPRSASVDALEPLTVVVVARDALEKELGQTFWVGHILRAVTERFRDLDARLRAEENNIEGAVREELLRYMAFHGEVGINGGRRVSWNALRRHLKQRLKLGDLQVMSLCAGVRGLHVDDAGDQALLEAEPAASSARPGSRSVPAMPTAPPERPRDDTLPPFLESAPRARMTPAPVANDPNATALDMRPFDPDAPLPRPPPPPAVSALGPDFESEPAILETKPRPRTGAMPALPSPRPKTASQPAIQVPSARPPSAQVPSTRASSARPPSRVVPTVPPPPPSPPENASPFAPTPRPKSQGVPSVPEPLSLDEINARRFSASKAVRSAAEDPATVADSGPQPLRPTTEPVANPPPPEHPAEFAATEMMPENMDIDALIAAAEKSRDGSKGGQGGEG